MLAERWTVDRGRRLCTRLIIFPFFLGSVRLFELINRILLIFLNVFLMLAQCILQVAGGPDVSSLLWLLRMSSSFQLSGRDEGRPARKTPVNKSVRFSEFSITVGTPGRDIGHEAKAGLQNFVHNYCKMAYFGLERGSSREYLHWQGVIITHSNMAANALNRKIKQYLGWLGQQEGKPHVKVKALTHNNDLHTSIGMSGYCSKDMGKEYFDEIRKEVTDKLLERGKEMYSVLGNKDFKERVCLTKDNIFERAFIFWLYSRSVQRYHTVPFITIRLRKMLQSGNYYLNAEWVTKSGEEMNPERAEAFWQILCSNKDGGPLIQDLEVALFSHLKTLALIDILQTFRHRGLQIGE
jgi:hypothetical protein